MFNKNELNNQPKFRFKEFKNRLIETSLSQISNFRKGDGLSRDLIDLVNGKNKCIHYGELSKLHPIMNKTFSMTNEFGKVLSTENEILVPIKASGGGSVYQFVSIKEKNIILGDAINIFKINKEFDSDYLSLLLNSRINYVKISKFIEGTTATQLLPQNLDKINFLVSTDQKEQNKIVRFFSFIFKRNEVNLSIKNKWKLILKSCNEKTFESRKKQQNYYKMVKNIGFFFNSYTGLVSLKAKDWTKKGNKYLSSNSIVNKLICNSFDLDDFKNNGKKQNQIHQKDILVVSTGVRRKLGSCTLYDSKDKPFLDETCFGIRLKNNLKKSVLPEYVNTILSLKEYKKETLKFVQGTIIDHLYWSAFSKIKIKLPSYENQLIISDLFSKFYKIIETELKIIEKQEIIKNYFINNMFS